MAKIIEFRVIESTSPTEFPAGAPYKAVTAVDNSNITIEKVEETLQHMLNCEEKTEFDFGVAVTMMREGHKIARKGWNGKGMFVYYVPANSYKTQTEVAKKEFGEYAKYNHYMALKGVDGVVSTWVPSVTDCLAEDWVVVE